VWRELPVLNLRACVWMRTCVPVLSALVCMPVHVCKQASPWSVRVSDARTRACMQSTEDRALRRWDAWGSVCAHTRACMQAEDVHACMHHSSKQGGRESLRAQRKRARTHVLYAGHGQQLAEPKHGCIGGGFLDELRVGGRRGGRGDALERGHRASKRSERHKEHSRRTSTSARPFCPLASRTYASMGAVWRGWKHRKCG